MEAIKEADLEDVKKEITAIQESAKIDASFDAASIMRDEITSAVDGHKEIGHSTIDLTAMGPAHETATTPSDGAPELPPPAPDEPVAAPKDLESPALSPPAVEPKTQAAVDAGTRDAPPPAPDEKADARGGAQHDLAPQGDRV